MQVAYVCGFGTVSDGIHTGPGPTCHSSTISILQARIQKYPYETYIRVRHTSGMFLHLFLTHAITKKSSHWTCIPTAGPAGKRLAKIKMSRLNYLWVAACNPDSGFIYNSYFPKDKAAIPPENSLANTPLIILMLIWRRTWRTQISNPKEFTEQCNTDIRLFNAVLAQPSEAMCSHAHCWSLQEPKACSICPQTPQNNVLTIIFRLAPEVGLTSYQLLTALTFS